MAMLREALLVHLKSSRVEPCQTSRLDTERHPGLHGQLEARTEDTMSPRVCGHVVGPTQHRHKRAVTATVTPHMLLENKLPLSLGRLPMAEERVKQQLKSIVPVYPPDAEEPVVDERKQKNS